VAEGDAEAAPYQEGRGPLRTCFVTRAVRPRGELLRLVAGPEGHVTLDVRGGAAGRGLWLDPTPDNLRQLVRLAPRAQKELGVPLHVDAVVEEIRLFTRRVAGERLGLGAKTGTLVYGHDAVIQALAAGKVLTVVFAADAAERTQDSVRGAAAARSNVRVLSVPWSAAEVGALTGRGLIAVFGVAGSSLTATLVSVLRRLSDLG
jgi:predicted RNA-binding protein YlxR (DUF448 family)/ribosomal protein L30E